LLRVISRDDPTGGKGKALNAEPYLNRFIEAMDDDFNTPQALAALFDLARAINQAADSGLSFLKARSVLLDLANNILGLKFESSEFIREPTAEIEQVVNRLIRTRQTLRKAKQWQLADEIRNKLANLNIILEDTRALDDTRGARAVAMWKREFKREITPEDSKLLDNLLTEAQAKLNELGIVLED